MTTKLKSVFWGFPQRLASDTRGFTLVLVTLMLSTLIGFTGLGVKTGFWYAIKRQNQSAADFAALSGAFELYAGQASGLTGAAIYPDVCALAKRDAARNNFTFISFTCPAASPGCTSPSSGQMCANNPPVLGSNKNNNSVEVILSQQQSTIIAGFFLPNVTIDTRAVATILTNDQACLLALGTTGTDISEQGNPSITMPGCAIAAASNSASAVALGGSSSLTASAVVTPGNCSGCGTVPVVHASVSDPYAAKLNHTFLTNGMPTSGTCSAVTVNGTPYFGKTGGCVTGGSSTIGDTLFGPMQISGGLTIKNNNVDLCPNGVCFVDVTTQGSGYTSTPTVVFSGGGGSGATATAIISTGKVTGVTVSAAGSGYTSAPTVSFTGGGGSGAAAAATLSSGTYWITDGDLDLANSKGTLDCPLCVAGGPGVTVILTNVSGSTGTLTLDAQANLNLSAPSSGTYAGLVLIQDPNAPAGTVNVKANATETLNGLVYFPNASMQFQGGPSAGSASCLVVVASTLQFQGNPDLTDTGCANAGLNGLPTPIVLVE